MLEKRRFGRTGHLSTVVTFGGVALSGTTPEQADATLALVSQYGVNHIDIAPSYGDAEVRLGPWLEQHRDQVFLGCKTSKRTRAEATAEMERSLERLRTDRFDLYQLHSVADPAELDKSLAPGGAIETLLKARERGITRYLGITGHGRWAPSTFARALERFDFDSVLFPFNAKLYADPAYRRDYERLVEVARARDVGLFVIKALCHGPWGERSREYRTWYEPLDDQATIDRAIAVVLSQPAITSLASAGDWRLVPMVLSAAERYREITDAQKQELVAAAAGWDPLFTEAI
ncbi:MAG: aldo/keto reductase [Chloroflexi bacterium]|nr:aldo/keto reductase [Chloroflexota bacterium]